MDRSLLKIIGRLGWFAQVVGEHPYDDPNDASEVKERIMSRPIFLIGVTVTLSMATCAAYALVLGGTNFDLMGYPRPSCTKPFTKPVPPYNSNDRYEVERYNSEADSYNTQVSRYVSCIRTYVENADNDIKRIRESERVAIDEIKSL